MSVDRQGPAEKVEIYRVYYSYVKAGDDGQTPAMRRWLARRPCTVEDILYFAHEIVFQNPQQDFFSAKEKAPPSASR